jgi:hypothetical protein
MAADEPITIRGTCHVLFAFDLGLSIDLDAARLRLGAGRATGERTLIESKPTPKYFEYHPPPVRTSERTEAGAPPPIAGFEVAPEVDATLFDFGAACVSYRIPFEASPERLTALSVELYDHAGLLEDARRRVEDVARALGGAVSRPRITEVAEDYVVFVVDPVCLPGPPESFSASRRGWIAGLLRAEPRELSGEEAHDAFSCRISYTPGDLTLIDWNGALVVQDDPADLLAVLEFANVELLEMRHLDGQLDRALDEAYRVTQSKPRWSDMLLRRSAADQQRIAKLQVDNALLFEGVNNALKLLGDQFLARVYRLAAQRLHLPEWDAAILRKLETLNSIYEKMSDRQANRRMEILEWIIIGLIAFEIGMSLWGRK